MREEKQLWQAIEDTSHDIKSGIMSYREATEALKKEIESHERLINDKKAANAKRSES